LDVASPNLLRDWRNNYDSDALLAPLLPATAPAHAAAAKRGVVPISAGALLGNTRAAAMPVARLPAGFRGSFTAFCRYRGARLIAFSDKPHLA